MTAKRLSSFKTQLRNNLKKGIDTTVREKRVKAYERLKNSLNNTPGDLNCNANYEVEVAELVPVLQRKLSEI